MGSNWLKLLISFFILIFLQVLVLNHMSFGGYATPFLYIYFIIKMPIGVNRNLLVFLGFLLGFIIDIFCNTLGQNAAATVFVAAFCQSIQGLFFSRDDFEDYTPSVVSLGNAFFKYAFLVILIHHAILILISSFSYLNPVTIGLRIILSTLLTFVLVFAIEGLFVKKKKHE